MERLTSTNRVTPLPARRLRLPRLEVNHTALRRLFRRSPLWLVVLLLVGGLLAHRGWFRPGVLTAADWGYDSSASLRDLFTTPRAWDGTTAFGAPNTALSSAPYQLAMGWLGSLGASYAVVERLVFFFPFALLPFIGMYRLGGLFTREAAGRAAMAALYGLNTYISVIGTNQLTVGMGYVLGPFVLTSFLKALRDVRAPRTWLFHAVAAGAWLAAANAYDTRMGYLLAAACAFFTVAAILGRNGVRASLGSLAVTLATFVALGAYWIVPSLGARATRSSLGSLVPDNPFISFAGPVHALALNHPFWTGGQFAWFEVHRPNYVLLGLPVLAFGALLVRRHRHDWRLVAFAVLALVGVFLVKGQNDPLGGVYTWAFRHVPGMRLYREMSKFNLYVALGYSVLSGMTVAWAVRVLAARRRLVPRPLTKELAAVALVVFAVCLGICVAPALAQKLGRTTNPRAVPVGYKRLETVLNADRRFGRVLWLPGATRLAASTRRHPVLQPLDLTNKLRPPIADAASAIDVVHRADLVPLLRNMGVRYIAVDRGLQIDDGNNPTALTPWPGWPGEMSTSDAQARDATLRELAERAALEPVLRTRRLVVYRLRGPVSLATVGQPISYDSASATRRPVAGMPATDRPVLSGALARIGAGAPSMRLMAFPIESARFAPHRVEFPRFSLARAGVFLLWWGEGRPGRRDVVSIVRRDGSVAWRGRPAAGSLVRLRAGTGYRIVVRSSSVRGGMLPGGSFERSLWTPVFDAFAFDGRTLAQTGIAASASHDARIGRRALRLDANAHMAGISTPQVKVRRWERLVLRFYWKRVRGTRVAYAPYFGRAASMGPVLMDSSRGWNRFTTVFDVPTVADPMASIGLYAGPGSEDRPTTALFDAVSLVHIPRWLSNLWLTPVVAHGERSVASDADGSRLTFTATTAGPRVVRVTTTYNPDWNASFDAVRVDGSRARLAAVHVRTNDDLNGWVLSVPRGTKRVEASLSFGAQRLTNVGSILSLAALAVVLVFLASSGRARR